MCHWYVIVTCLTDVQTDLIKLALIDLNCQVSFGFKSGWTLDDKDKIGSVICAHLSFIDCKDHFDVSQMNTLIKNALLQRRVQYLSLIIIPDIIDKIHNTWFIMSSNISKDSREDSPYRLPGNF